MSHVQLSSSYYSLPLELVGQIIPYLSSKDWLNCIQSDMEQFEVLKDQIFWKNLFEKHFGSGRVKSLEDGQLIGAKKDGLFMQNFEKTLEKFKNFINRYWHNFEQLLERDDAYIDTPIRLSENSHLNLPLINLDIFDLAILGQYKTYDLFYNAVLDKFTNISRKIIESDFFNEMPRDFLNHAFNHPDLEIVGLLINSNRFHEISNRQLNETFAELARSKHNHLVMQLIKSNRFQDISQSGLFSAFINCDPEIVELLINSNRFNEIPSYALRSSLQFGDEKVVKLIINSNRFEEFSRDDLNQVFKDRACNGSSEIIKLLINSGRFNEISKDVLNEAFSSSLRTAFSKAKAFSLRCPFMLKNKEKRIEIVKLLINSNRLQDIYDTNLLDAFQCGHAEVVQMIINSNRFSDIPIYVLNHAFVNAIEEKKTEIVKLLINNNRFQDIYFSNLLYAFQYEHVEVVQMIINSNRFKDVSNEVLANAFEKLLCNKHLKDYTMVLRRQQIIERFLNVNRFQQVFNNSLERFIPLAFNNGWLEVIINSDNRFKDIFKWTVKSNRKEIISVLVDMDRFQQIFNSFLGRMIRWAARKKYLRIISLILSIDSTKKQIYTKIAQMAKSIKAIVDIKKSNKLFHK